MGTPIRLGAHFLWVKGLLDITGMAVECAGIENACASLSDLVGYVFNYWPIIYEVPLFHGFSHGAS